MTERNTTKRGYAIWKRKRCQCRCDDGWKNYIIYYAGFVSNPDIFCEEGVYKVYDKNDGTPFKVVSPDGSLRRSADGLVDIHTNPPLSLEIKFLFHLHKGFQCILRFQIGISDSARYMKQMDHQSEGHLLLCWSPKNGYIKMLRIITFVTHSNAYNNQFDINVNNGVAIAVDNDVRPVKWMEVYPSLFNQSKSPLHANIECFF